MEWLRENHPIIRYCETLGMTLSAFASLVHTNPTQISYLINGQRRCSRDLGLRIHTNTGGAINLQELLEWGKEAA
jgi:plasmid maintenance system antidote protein VapI